MPQQPSPHSESRHRARRRGTGAAVRWVPPGTDALVQGILDNSLRSACGLIGASGGFVVCIREAHLLDVVCVRGLDRSAVLDAVLGAAAPVLHGALLERQLTSNDAEPGTGSIVAIPLDMGTGNGSGALCLLRELPRRALSTLDFEILDALAGQATLALAAARQQDALSRLQARLHHRRR